MGKYKIDWDQYAATARRAAAEGAVLLRNENHALPLKKGEKISVFGRIQTKYYKSGTGSGGAVHTRYVVSILDALKNCDSLSLNEKVLNAYQEWEKTHPFDQGVGWAGEPWCQEEMKLEESFVEEMQLWSLLDVLLEKTRIIVQKPVVTCFRMLKMTY